MARDLQRLARMKEELRSYIYYNLKPLEEIYYKDGGAGDITDTDGYSPYPKDKIWGRDGEMKTFKFSAAADEELAGKPLALLIDSYFYKGSTLENPQYLVYVNGAVKQGLDINHREILLTEEAKLGESYDLTLEGWPGAERHECVLRVTIGNIHRAAERLYYNFAVGYETLAVMDENDGRYAGMKSVLLDALNMLDLRRPYSREFDESVANANRFIEENLYNKYGNNDVKAWAIAHTHIDVAWLWRLKHTRLKAQRSFSTVLDYMNRYPEYMFSSSQPQLYKFVKEDCPELYSRIKERVEEGRFEPEGGMWLEADCNLISGESMVRQLMFGKRFFKEEFGAESEVLWLPDVFGYSAAMPQILKKAGIKYFVTSKISWNDTNHMPNDTFLWEGIDGTEILSYFHTAPDPGQAKEHYIATYNAVLCPDVVLGTWQRYRNKDINNEVMLSYGWGDGGGGPTKDQIEYAKRLKNGLGAVPAVKLGGMRDFMRSVEKNVKNKKRLPKWVGELYLEFHRGTYTSMARNKKYNRRCEMSLRSLEYLCIARDKLLERSDYPAEELNKAWEVVLLNQFHDIIPGSSIKGVYDDSKEQYEAVLSDIRGLTDKTIRAIADNIQLDGEGITVFNDSGKVRSDVLIAKTPDYAESVTDDEGKSYPIQKLSDGNAAFYAENIPAFGYKTFSFSEKSAPSGAVVSSSAREIETPYFRVRFDENMEIESLFDKNNDRELVPDGARINRLSAYEDKPEYFEAWELSEYYKEKAYPVDNVLSVKIKESGAVCTVVEIVREYMSSRIKQEIWFYNDVDRIDFKTEIDWKEKQTHLRASFPADIHSNKASFEIQYGNLERPTHNNTSWDQAKFEVCAHKWIDLSEYGYGLSLLNDCKYGFSVKNGAIELAMLKSAIYPNPEADKEKHEFTYSLYPHKGAFREAKTVEYAYNLNAPMLYSIGGVKDGKLPPKLEVLSVNADNVQVEAIKKAERGDDIIIRLYEYKNKRAEAELDFYKPIKKAVECDLLENELSEPDGATAIRADKNKLRFKIKPYEIKTIKITV